MLTVTVVGAGPWGLSFLERLVSGLRDRPGAKARIHVIEPSTPGAGVFAVDQPDWLILNTPCGQHSMYALPGGGSSPRYAVTFFEWVQAQGYTWVGDRCERTTAGRPITEHDFLPRRVMGEYLNWFFGALVSQTPAGVKVQLHPTSAIDVTRTAGGRERVRLADGTAIDSDHVVISTGHTPNAPTRLPAQSGMLAPYPVTAYHAKLPADVTVGIAGMGLVAMDVVSALTVGRGGSYAPTGQGRLRYLPSGSEPALQMFSPSGDAYCAKAVAQADPTGDYQPVICTLEAVTDLQGTGARRRQLDARRELLPLVFAEMQVRYYMQSALLAGDADRGAGVAADLAAAWQAGRFEEGVARLARRFEPFDPSEHFFASSWPEYPTNKHYQEHVYELISRDLDAALYPGGPSPVKAAYEVLRVLRDTMRTAIEFRGLTLASYRDFQSNIRSRVNRLVAGPPALRSQQLLALMDAGVVRLPYGPAPVIETSPEGTTSLRSTRLANPHQEEVGLMVQGHLDDPGIPVSASRLLSALYLSGRLRELSYGEVTVGSLEMTEDLHPVDSAGVPAERLWLVGAWTEGVRYFTHYIPSPKSRIRAFVDAQRCVEQILG